MPARVIDLRMRFAIDEFGAQFLNSSLAEKPDNGQNTLVILFDRHNTAFVEFYKSHFNLFFRMWIPNHKLEHLSIAKMNSHSNQSANFVEALNKAKQFW